MNRSNMIDKVGKEFLTTNVENDEFSYQKAFKDAGIEFKPIFNKKGRKFKDIDIRFEKNHVSILIETKQKFCIEDEEQLSAYVEYEKKLTGNKIIAILANTIDNKIKVWKNDVSNNNILTKEIVLKTIDEYIDLFSNKINNKEKVMKNTYELNEMLHKYGIAENLRSQFIGTCLLALKNNLTYNEPDLTTTVLTVKIKVILGSLLNSDINKAQKLAILSTNVLESQDVSELKIEDFKKILNKVKNDILPFINDKSTAGQDLLNLFFVTFNKYTATDKNQAFTPDHITDFMAKITGINKNSVILDPCCGSGSFLVRAMTQALADCDSEEERNNVKQKQIYGIEHDKNIYGLATTNMLIHGDGNSNIRQGSCFELKKWIQESRPNVILMNPPYNASKKHVPQSYYSLWSEKTKEDPSKGLFFAKYIMDILNEIHQPAIMAILLPVACAIGNSDEIKKMKIEILKENTLDAVFTLPPEVFYPGASASVCCMVFKIGKKNSDLTNPETFFGYYKNDNFKKKKNLGRIEQINKETGNSLWKDTEKLWIDLYRDRRVVDGLSSKAKITGTDEWLCEAYMKTDYNQLKQSDFEKTIRQYLAYKIQSGRLSDDE